MSYLRILLIMVLSFTVVLVGTIAVVDVEQNLARNDGLWIGVFVFAVAAVISTVVAARVFRKRG